MIYCYVSNITSKQHIVNPLDNSLSLCFQSVVSKIQGKTNPDTDICMNCIKKLKWLNRIKLK